MERTTSSSSGGRKTLVRQAITVENVSNLRHNSFPKARGRPQELAKGGRSRLSNAPSHKRQRMGALWLHTALFNAVPPFGSVDRLPRAQSTLFFIVKLCHLSLDQSVEASPAEIL